jgi:hypothetical protein
LDRDLETFRDVWRGEPFNGGTNPAVPTGTRQIPLMFGGFAPAVMNRMALGRRLHRRSISRLDDLAGFRSGQSCLDGGRP